MALGQSGTGPVAWADRWAAVRAVVLNPTQLVAPLFVAPLYVLGIHVGFLARVPLWLVLGALAVTQISTSIMTLVLPPGGPSWHVFVRTGFMVVMTGVTVYVTGWGAVFAIGFVFNAAEQVRVDGSRAARLTVPWIVLTVIGGELAIALHWAPSQLPQPEGHGLAVLCALGAVTMSLMLGWITAAK